MPDQDGMIEVTMPACASDVGVPTARMPYWGIQPSLEQIFDDSLEVLSLSSAAHHGPDFLPRDGWKLVSVADDVFELHR